MSLCSIFVNVFVTYIFPVNVEIKENGPKGLSNNSFISAFKKFHSRKLKCKDLCGRNNIMDYFHKVSRQVSKKR